jgi:LysM repeat protein
VDQPDKWYRPPAPGPGSVSKPKTAIASNTQVAPEPHVPLIGASSPPEPRPQTTVAKPKPTPKPKPPTVVRHTVKRGDTLSALARRYGTSVTKIQKANGLPNTVIRLGQTLKIPK